ncbi:6-phosphogluconolactonase [Nibricoccus aquaticus]|uniref:6-phosphogluconolactonase n=2 Tax=Nibricoccus aquaticus TaxID=2576891 RepID=A0A290Q499_9BACT|nr:6-phosphogluconolactonase [Nibricoccus aquaticus]
MRAEKVLFMLRPFRPFLLLIFMTTLAAASTTDSTRLVYFGTYTKKESKGLYAARFDTATGTFTPATLVAPAGNPTFIALHPRLPILYALHDLKNDQGGNDGAVTAYMIDPATGALTVLNSRPAGGPPLCYIHADPAGRALLISSYHGGYVASYPLLADGSIGERASFIKHTGKGPQPAQDAPHAHCFDFVPGTSFAFSADLGADKIVPYRVDPATAALTPNGTPYAAHPGSGPRHLAFHPNKRFAYAINELTATVTAFTLDASTGSLGEIETVDAIPGDFIGRRWGAEIAIHPNGQFLYASLRADHESIALFSIDEKSGRLTFIAHTHEGIKHPRHFIIDPTGRWLLCANHDTNNVNVFAIDQSTGLLTPNGHTLPVLSPVCILFAH